MNTATHFKPAPRRAATVLVSLLAFIGFQCNLRADYVICPLWNGNTAVPPVGLYGSATFTSPEGSSTPVTVLPGRSHINGAVVFPSVNHSLDSLNVSFGIDMHGGAPADGVAFSFAPFLGPTGPYLDEKGNTNGLAAEFIVNVYDQQNYGTFNLYYRGQLVDTMYFGANNPLFGDFNTRPQTCRPNVLFTMSIKPGGLLTWQIQLQNGVHTCGITFDTGPRNVSLGTNDPLYDGSWQAYFSGRCGEGSMEAELDNINIVGLVSYPRLIPVPTLLTANQDQSSVPVALNLNNDDPTWPASSAVVQVTPSDPTMIPTANINLTGTGATRQLSFQGARGRYGTNAFTVSLYYPGANYTNSYVIPVNIAQNIPPTVSLPASVTIQQGRSLSIPFSYGSQSWSLLNLTVNASQFPAPTGDYLANGLQVIQPIIIPNAPGTVNSVLSYSPRLYTNGTANVQVAVTDPSGGQAVSTMAVTVVPQGNPPTVAGERTAVSFNEAGATGQYGVDPVGVGALGGNFTIEAWVRPSALPLATFNPIISFGNGAIAEYAMLALQSNGIPSFAGDFNDAVPTTGASVPLNQWSHVVVAIQGQTAAFYVNGQPAGSKVLPQPMNVQAGPLAVARDLANLTYFSGQIDEVRVWNVTRTASEIQASFRTKLNGATPGLVRYYDFDEGFSFFTAPQFVYAVDRSGSGLPLDLTNLPPYVPGVALDVPLSTTEGQPLTVPVVAENVVGTNWYGTAGVMQEVFLNTYANVPSFTNGYAFPNNPYAMTPFGDSLEVAPGAIINEAGERFRGYLLPPETGTYTFWIASQNDSQFLLSTNDQASGEVLIASSPAAGVSFRQWNANPSQRSAAIPLVAGQRYYFEIFHVVNQAPANPGFLSVQWQLPDNTIESPLPAYRVQPVSPSYSTNSPQIVISAPPNHGSLTISNGNLMYVPDPYYFGPDDFFYSALDLGQTSAPAHIVLQVNNSNNQPTVGNGTALYFDGVSGQIQSAGSASLSLSNRSFTVEAWASRPDPLAREWLLSQGQPSTNQGLIFGWDTTNNAAYFKFGFWGDDLQMSTPFSDTNWHHWAATFDLSSLTRKIYEDGVLVAQDVATGPLATPATAMLFVASQFGGAPFFHGGISEVRIWDHVRTAQELQETMNTPLVGTEEGLMVYYRLNEGNGLTANDSSSAPPYPPLTGIISGGITWLTNTMYFGTVTVPRNLGPGYIPNQIFLPAFDPSGSQLTYLLVGGHTNGIATIPNPTMPFLSYTPNLYAKGSDIIRYFVKNAQGTSSGIATILISIASSNVPPDISSFLDQAVEEDDPPLTLSFTVSDIDVAAANLTVNGQCSNPTLLPQGSFSFGGSGNNRTVTLTPVAGEIGSGTVVITVSDGQLTASQQFNYQVKGRLAFAPVDLGILTGQPYSEADAINAAGQVVGFTASDNQQDHPRGFLYTGFGPLAQNLPVPTLGGDGSRLNGVNSLGKSAGWSVDASGIVTNVILADPGPPVTLTSLGTMVGGTMSVATAINDEGYTAGYGDVGGGVQHPFLALSNGPLVDLGLPAGATRAFALAINNSRTVVGYSVTGVGQTNAFVYNGVGSNFTTLTLSLGATGSVATAINDAGEIGGYVLTGGQIHAALALTTNWTDLGDILGGGAARINGFNHFRQAVGTAMDTNGQWQAFYYENGAAYNLNALLPLGSGWNLVDARAINDQAQIVGVGQKDGQTRAFLLFPATEIGRRVFRPVGTLPTMPQVNIIQADPGNNSLNSFFWSDNDQKLFAVRPVAALVNWHTGRYVTYTNLTQFGDTYIAQVFTNEVLVPTLSYNVWPSDANLQVASAPVELQPPFPGFSYSFVEMPYTTIDGAAVDANDIFHTPLQSTGYSVFRYLISNGQPANPQLQKVRFDVTRTITWDDTNYLVTNVTATVGDVVTNAAHNDYPGRTGWLVFSNAYYDGAGPNPAYISTNRGGNIIPVNAVTNRDNFVVAWYKFDLLGVAWPNLPVKYHLLWPTNAPHLVIASGLGFGPLDPTVYPNPQIYNQPDVTQPGFNPNEEHALFAPSPTGTGTSLFALRCDLNHARPGIPSDSEPFVLLKYTDPATGLWRIQPLQVVAEEDPYHFVYPGTAGSQIEPPYPLSVLPQSSSTYAASGPSFEDVAGRFYALAGGEPFGQSTIVMRFFYPLQPGFWYDLNNDGTNDLPVGASVPWLSQLNNDQDLNQPIDATYQISWPTNLPTLAIGETLYGAAHGLPDVQDMASAQVVYDSLSATLPSAVYGDLTQLARLFDPITARTVPVVGSPSWLTTLNLQTDPTTGTMIFADLPYYLRIRLYYDPVAHALCFKGVSLPQPAGNPLMLVNIMSLRERNRIQALDGANGTTDFDNLVEQLYVMTRNPNQLDIQPRDGKPDDALLVGLTYDSTGTNITFEKFGSGPKALTAGLPQIITPLAEGQWLNFDGAQTVGTTVELTSTNPYPDITNNFTIEFWARPSAGMQESQESNDGIEPAHMQGRFAIFPPQGTDAYGSGHATAGISVGTNGVSVYQHSANYLPSVLVYTAPITNWTHVAVSYASGTPSLYLNGDLVAVGLPTISGITVHPGSGLGGEITRLDFGRYAGDLEDVRIWNYTVPQPLLQARQATQLVGTEAGLVGYWRLNEGSGTTVSDSSSRKLGGTVYRNYAPYDGGWAQGAGPASGVPRYEVIAENNDPSLPGLPVTLHVIQIGGGPYMGSIAQILPDNVLDQRATLRHNADFAGDPQQLEFQWYYYPASGGSPPALPDPANPTANGWIPFPDSGQGVNDITTGEGDVSTLITMSDNWYVMRYRGYNIDGVTNWSNWIGDPASTTTTRPLLLEGWIQRVLDGINLFNQRNTDFSNFQVNTLVSSLAQAGPRYEGDVALNPSALDTPGLIQIYQTVLNRAESLSINASPPVDYAPANQALLQTAGEISDLYMLFGNEAAAEAADPTVPLNDPNLALPDGSFASSIYPFENEVSSQLEQELCLLRGRDDTSAGVGAPPVYNRLYWNFTGGDGEVAYVAKFNISDYNADGSINAADAAILYPQGHGDAWGHYLTALTTYYGLLQNTNFTWIPQTEAVTLGGVTVEVGYLHERKFAAAAEAEAQTGAEIMDRTFRWDYSTDPTGLWSGYKDSNPQRAWGVTEWGWRAGSGAYYNWLTGNAILPAIDTNHTGIEEIDRTTVPELPQIASEAIQIQSVLDSVDRGYNPLGLNPNAVQFDLDPTTLQTSPYPTTHFDQVYARALSAVQNAVTTFNQASELSDALRQQADTESDFGSSVSQQETAYRNQLIGIFGYPYSGDIGPNTPNPAGYIGPDLYHWMYIDTTGITTQNTPPGTNFTALYKPFQDEANQWGFQFSDDVTNAMSVNDTTLLQVNYPLSTGDFLFQAPASWGSRQAEGSLQTALRNIVEAKASYAQAVVSYNQQVASIQSQLNLLQARFQLDATQIQLLDVQEGVNSTLNSLILVAQATQLAAEEFSQTTETITGSLVEAIPKVEGLADDALAPVRGTILAASVVPQTTLETLKNAAALSQDALQFGENEESLVLQVQNASAQNNFAQQQDIADLQNSVRSELGLRVTLFQQAETLQQAIQTYQTTLAQGQQVLQQRLTFRQLTAGTVAQMRYRDLAFRILLNDALAEYDTQFSLAARYVFLAAKAFDYEVNLDTAGAGDLATAVVSERSIGQVVGGVPDVSRSGLAGILGQLEQNFQVLEPTLGLNNVQNEEAQFSLRTEWQRITNSASWTALLQNATVTNLWNVPEFVQYCRPFAPQSAGSQPGIVIDIPGTTITAGLNFFGRPLAAQDYSYDPSEFSTRIRSVAVWFTGYDTTRLARAPRCYLIPVGADILRSPDALDFTLRTWQVVEQKIPIPFPSTSTTPDTWLTDTLNITDQFADTGRHSALLAYPDQGYNPEDFNPSTRLIGRSVANTRWMLIIPGAYLNGDPNQGLTDFINSVTDIKLDFQTYSASGN